MILLILTTFEMIKSSNNVLMIPSESLMYFIFKHRMKSKKLLSKKCGKKNEKSIHVKNKESEQNVRQLTTFSECFNRNKSRFSGVSAIKYE